jgi:hypothetical protein
MASANPVRHHKATHKAKEELFDPRICPEFEGFAKSNNLRQGMMNHKHYKSSRLGKPII